MSKKKVKRFKFNRRRPPVFSYISACCNAPAKKPACVRDPDDKRQNKYSRSGLGHWHCVQCSRNCKVTRSRIPEKEDSVHLESI